MLARLWGWLRNWRVRRMAKTLRRNAERDGSARITLHDDLTPQGGPQWGQTPWFLFNERGGDA